MKFWKILGMKLANAEPITESSFEVFSADSNLNSGDVASLCIITNATNITHEGTQSPPPPISKYAFICITSATTFVTNDVIAYHTPIVASMFTFVDLFRWTTRVEWRD